MKGKRKSLTARERRLFKALTEGKTQTEAAIEAGYAHPGQAGHRAVQNIKEKAPDLFARHGLDDDAFVEKCLIPALNANETKFFAHEGVVRDQRDVIAWGPRTATNALVARMKGLIMDNREPSDSGKPTIQVVVVNGVIRPHASDSAT